MSERDQEKVVLATRKFEEWRNSHHHDDLGKFFKGCDNATLIKLARAFRPLMSNGEFKVTAPDGKTTYGKVPTIRALRKLLDGGFEVRPDDRP
jgi:cell wall assembly regulator SMI1